jgi:hypothetical protein
MVPVDIVPFKYASRLQYLNRGQCKTIRWGWLFRHHVVFNKPPLVRGHSVQIGPVFERIRRASGCCLGLGHSLDVGTSLAPLRWWMLSTLDGI